MGGPRDHRHQAKHHRAHPFQVTGANSQIRRAQKALPSAVPLACVQHELGNPRPDSTRQVFTKTLALNAGNLVHVRNLPHHCEVPLQQ